MKQILNVWILQFFDDFLSCPECIYKCQDCINISYKTLYSKQRNRIYPGNILYLLSYWLSSGLIPPDSHCATSFISFSSLYPARAVGNMGPWERVLQKGIRKGIQKGIQKRDSKGDSKKDQRGDFFPWKHFNSNTLLRLLRIFMRQTLETCMCKAFGQNTCISSVFGSN